MDKFFVVAFSSFNGEHKVQRIYVNLDYVATLIKEGHLVYRGDHYQSASLVDGKVMWSDISYTDMPKKDTDSTCPF